MNHQFDELAKNMAQSTTRRGALKKFGIGIVGIALTALGLANNAEAKKAPFHCNCNKPDYGCAGLPADIYSACILTCPAVCQPY